MSRLSDMTSGPPTRVPALDRRPPDRCTDLARVRLQLDRMIQRRRLRPLTPTEQAYIDVLQDIEDDLLEAARLVKHSRDGQGATAHSEHPQL